MKINTNIEKSYRSTPPFGGLGGLYTVVLTNGTLNLRAIPSTSGTILASIPNYSTVESTVIVPYQTENETADGMAWKSVVYNGTKGWVASQYLTAGSAAPLTVTPRENGILNPNINPQNSNNMFTLTEETKKKLKIGAAIVGVALVGFGIYKMTAGKKQAALPAGTSGLSGVSRRRRKTKKKSKKSTSKGKRKSLKLN